ncbi:phosphonate ABC transporter, permease protein PhnE [Paenibacillus urinalis]|uniref:Phosphonate ABC transporter, permease protein PhnE n=1 Tax=Paenibacillus urinalis TaxID=521520 RepID=A0ABY7X7B0_9BACL|nr:MULTISPECIES: phosphonate ABC transporter, permease protein PhnE [Paenibacillus]WDH97101.1 phosphonate ABC transporter, permease protein PhnE [Paenibacillus urinalis]WDI00764.1 phosphonate ABC transporter, permease protein PhnE [Paenibacillus urinalis]GAK39443.1 phosphonate ABC transporter permease protein [Paenibacillus sp. TCA20]
MYDKLFPPKQMVLDNGKVVMQKRTRLPLILIILAILTAASVQLTGFDLQLLFSRIKNFFKILGEMVPPNWSYFPKLLEALLATLQMSLLGSMIGAILALPFALLASSNVMRNKVITSIFKIMMSLLRTLPTLVTALIATFIFGLGPMAGLVAIILFTLSYVGKLLYEQIENVDMGPFEAMESIGMNRVEAFRYAIFPQVLSRYLSTSLFCFEGNVRYAAILGYVGAGGIGLLIKENLGWRDYSNVGMIVFALVITVYIIESISEHFRKKLT